MKNTLLTLMAALITALFAVAPPNIYADSVWPKEVNEKPDFRHVIYTVRRGDKLEHIARNHSSSSYQISVANIIELNLIKNPNRILVGQKLQLPMYYAKEVQVVMPAEIQAAIRAAVLPKETELVEVKLGQLIIWGVGILIAVMLFIGFRSNLTSLKKCIATEQDDKNTETEVFLTHAGEIQDLLKKCTGRDVAVILESELVDVPRNPGSAVMNKKKLVNLKDLMHNNPELYDMPLESWSAHLAAKINGVASASAESA